MGSSNNNNGGSGSGSGSGSKHRNSNSAIDRKERVKMRKVVLGLGFWVQGLRCLPWMAVNFYLKDGIKVDPSTLQLLQNSANLPMVAKPIYGLLSDSVYISGQHRLPYIAIGGIFSFVPLLDLFFLLLLSYLPAFWGSVLFFWLLICRKNFM